MGLGNWAAGHSSPAADVNNVTKQKKRRATTDGAWGIPPDKKDETGDTCMSGRAIRPDGKEI